MIICRLIIIIFFLLRGFSYAAPVLELKDSITDFAGMNIVLAAKGDDPSYRLPDYDDSGWDRVSLPSSWDSCYPGWSGICWYRVHIMFPEKLPLDTKGIELGIITDTDEVFFNGTLIGKTGKFPPERESAYDIKRVYEIPSTLIRPGRENILAVRVAGLLPGENGPYKGEFRIGPFKILQREFYAVEIFNIFFVILYLAAGIYFSLIFLKGLTREYLFFSLFTISVSVYLFLRTQIKYLVTGEFYFLKRTEYIVLILILLFMMEYVTYLLKKKHSYAHFIYYTAVAVSLSFVLISGNPYVWNQALRHLIQPSWIIPLSWCIYASWREMKTGRDQEAKYLLWTFLLTGIMFINDVFIERRVYSFINLTNYGFLIVIAGTGLIMRKRTLNLNRDAELFRTRKERKPEITEDTKKKFDRAVAYINENFTADISRENMAEAIGLNHDYLGKLFMQIKNMKMNDYINELRINRACELLSGTDTPVIEISLEVGYDNLSTFYRVFQDRVKMSPAAYREVHKKL